MSYFHAITHDQAMHYALLFKRPMSETNIHREVSEEEFKAYGQRMEVFANHHNPKYGFNGD